MKLTMKYVYTRDCNGCIDKMIKVKSKKDLKSEQLLKLSSISRAALNIGFKYMD